MYGPKTLCSIWSRVGIGLGHEPLEHAPAVLDEVFYIFLELFRRIELVDGVELCTDVVGDDVDVVPDLLVAGRGGTTEYPGVRFLKFGKPFADDGVRLVEELVLAQTIVAVSTRAEREDAGHQHGQSLHDPHLPVVTAKLANCFRTIGKVASR